MQDIMQQGSLKKITMLYCADMHDSASYAVDITNIPYILANKATVR